MHNELQDWGEAYKSIADHIADKVPAIKHIDLYYGQEQAVDQDGNWIPFLAPAVWLEFNANEVADLMDKRQLITMDVGVYLAFETVQDSNRGSLGQARALQYIGLLRQLHQHLHGHAALHHGPMTRVAMNRVDAPPTMVLYRQVFRCAMLDYGATANHDELENPALELGRPAPPAPPDPAPLYPGLS